MSLLIKVNPLKIEHRVMNQEHPQLGWEELYNDIAPWSDAIDAIFESEEKYKNCSRKVKLAAESFVQEVLQSSYLDYLN